MKKKIFPCLLCLLLVLPLAADSKDMDGNVKKGWASINWSDVYNYCRTMSEPRFAGRHTVIRVARWGVGTEFPSSWDIRGRVPNATQELNSL